MPQYTKGEEEIPEFLSRKGQGTMPAEDLQSAVKNLLSDAVQFADNELGPIRALSEDYYNGAPFGNEEEGQSQIVLTEVKDAILGQLPDVLRVFFAGERVVEFLPRTKDPAATRMAAEATDTVQFVFEEDNSGFLVAHDVIKDALVKKLGFIKWSLDEEPAREQFAMQGLLQEQMEAIARNPDFKISRIERHRTEGQPDRLDIEVIREIPGAKVKVWAVPPEEMLFSRDGRTVESAQLVAHRTEKSRGELLAMGFKEDDIEEYGGAADTSTLRNNVETLARRALGYPGRKEGHTDAPEIKAGEANEKVLYTDAYAFIDFDGDGIAELRRLECLGSTFHVCRHRPALYRPFAPFCADPTPHWIVGASWADRLMDLQKMMSSVARAMNNSLALSIHPRMAFLDGQVNVQDLLNTAMAAPIREKVAGAVRPIVHEFVGREGMPVLEFYQGIIERRTGRNRGVAGLDADALQSTTDSAVQAAELAARGQTEMICRLFAEMTLKPLFRGILRELAHPEAQARMVRINGAVQEVQPATFDPNMSVMVNVALGTSDVPKKIATLTAIATKQAELLATLGPTNPICSLAQYSNTLTRIIMLSGYKNTTEFFNQVPPDWQPPPAAPQPTPEQVLAEGQLKVEQLKTQKDAAIKKDELTLKEKEMDQRFALEQRKIAVDAEVRKYVAELQFSGKASEANLRAELAQLELEFKKDTTEAETTLGAIKDAHAVTLAREKHEHDMTMAREQMDHDKRMAEAELEANGATGAE